MDDRISSVFDDKLLEYMMEGRNNKAKSLITRDLAKLSDDDGTLLHYAVNYNSEPLVRHLLNLDCEIDALGKRGCFKGRTALMIAVEDNRTGCVKALLEANAKVDVIDRRGKRRSALKRAFTFDNFDGHEVNSNIIRLLVRKLQSQLSSVDALIERLVDAGCTLHHATRVKNVEIMEALLRRGADVNLEGYRDLTALHYATEMNDLTLVEWLIDNGADANARDFFKRGPLFDAVKHGNAAMVKILLEHGADPNAKDVDRWTVLDLALRNKKSDDEEQLDECVKRLLQHGAVPRRSSTFDRALRLAASRKGQKRINYLIAHLATLDALGTAKAKSIMTCDEQIPAFSDFEKYFAMCEQILRISVFKNLSLLNLLTVSERKLKVLVRDETFVPQVKKVFAKCNLSEVYPYYYDTLMERIGKAGRSVELEEKSMLVISDIFKINPNKCYVAAREIVGYLDERDVEQLCQV